MKIYKKQLLLMIGFFVLFAGVSKDVSLAAGAAAEKSTEAAAEQSTSAAPKAEKKKKVVTLKQVEDVKLIRYSTTQVKLVWKGRKQASYYHIYRAAKKGGTYKQVGVTKDTHFLADGLKNGKTYYFKVQACHKKKASDGDGPLSKGHAIKMKTYQRKTVFAGDSVTEGINSNVRSQIKIGGTKKTIAYRGLNTITFRTRRVFGGKSGLTKLVAEKPYRIYLLLGLNEIHYRTVKQILPEYKGIIRTIKRECPNTDLVVCACSPVTKKERLKRTGFRQIPKYNKELKKLAEKEGVSYLDFTAFLKDKEGYLNPKYSAADGYHWQPSAYKKYAKEIMKYEKMRDH